MTPHGRRIATLAALALAAACKLDTAPPRVGPPAGSRPPPSGLAVAIEEAEVRDDRRVAVTVRFTENDLPLAAARVAELQPRLTLAGLATEPVTRLPAWRSYLELGAQAIPRLASAGPGTPEQPGVTVLYDRRQPGAEPATLEPLGDGRFLHVFATALPPAWTAAEPLRVGLFLAGVSGKASTSATLDFTAAGATPEVRETVVDAACATCHGVVRGHRATRIGVKLCVTCHTWQNADPDTRDPAALSTATALTDPNPLEFGRLVHRIHRGRYLPTLYQASSSAPAPALPSDAALPLPFYPTRAGLTPVAGSKFAVVGDAAEERSFGRVVVRTSLGGVPRAAEAAGIWFPRDYRDCAVCHAGARDQAALTEEISRRTCAGCHPDVWFGAFSGALDGVHLAHPGGPQADDSGCGECHVRSVSRDPLGPLAPLDEVHQAPLDRLAETLPRLELGSVTGLAPGQRPTFTVRAVDQLGPIVPLDAVYADGERPEKSPVPRALWSPPTGTNPPSPNSALSILLGGPFARTGPSEYGFAVLTDPGTGASITWPRSESVPVASVADGQGWYTYQFTQPVPDAATGVWTVVLTARRQGPTRHYDLATKRFSWPYTGETASEVAVQLVVHVDTATGTWRAGDPVPAGARRAVVDQALCERCHRRIALHGGTRNAVAGCLLCHTPERTDWNQRAKDAAGNVDRAQTFDGLEEQSIHFKVMVERIHTGSGQGTATLQYDPYVIHGNGRRPFFFGDGTFPDEIRRCDRCHFPGTWRPEAVPAGAGATVANETGAIHHAGTVAHAAEEPAVLPLRASCTSCHGNAFASSHAERNTVNGKEGCVACHGDKGQKPTGKVHGIE